jgi:hypothetical protein
MDTPYNHRGTQENCEQRVVEHRQQVHRSKPEAEGKKVR